MRLKSSPIHIALGALVVVFLLPQVFVVQQAFGGRDSLIGTAPHLVWGLIANTLLLGGIVVALALLMGFGAAWCVTRCEFPGRRVFSVLLCLPFAIPSYILAGIGITLSRNPWFPDVENFWGAVVILSLTLYPWVYIPAKAALVDQSRHYHEAALALGMNRWRRLWRVHLGLLMPTAGIAALLVFMAVLNDFGTASLLAVRTLSVGIEDFFGAFRRDYAAELALVGLSMPLLAVGAFALMNAKRASYNPVNRGGAVPRRPLGLGARVAVLGALSALLAVALVLPVGALSWWVLSNLHRIRLPEVWPKILDTGTVTILVSAITLVLATLIHLSLRGRRGATWWHRLAVVMNLNYAIPSIMLAIALLFANAALPEKIGSAFLSNSIALLTLGGCLTYLCFPYFAIRSGMQSLHGDVDDLCRVMGMSRFERSWSVFLPLLKKHIACGGLLVLVTMAKELPLSFTLQPFGFQSLSMRMYNFAGVGSYQEGAIYALFLVAVVAYPIVALDRMISGDGHAGR